MSVALLLAFVASPSGGSPSSPISFSADDTAVGELSTVVAAILAMD